MPKVLNLHYYSFLRLFEGNARGTTPEFSGKYATEQTMGVHVGT
jgi:hypothetical protein